MTEGVNEGIARAFDQGLLRSTSIMTVGEAAEDAIIKSHARPNLDVGIHLVLVDERPLLSPLRVSSLVGRDGFFLNRTRLLSQILSGKLNFSQVEAEWTAQVEKGLNAGLSITHMDSHQFVHLFPGLFKLSLKIAGRYEIPYVRNRMVDPWIEGATLARRVQWAGLWSWLYVMKKMGWFLSVPFVPTVGFLNAGGRMNPVTVLKSLERLNVKQNLVTVEVMLHPGTGDPYTSRKYRHWGYHWENDLNLALDKRLRRGFEQKGIQLTSFGEMS